LTETSSGVLGDAARVAATGAADGLLARDPEWGLRPPAAVGLARARALGLREAARERQLVAAWLRALAGAGRRPSRGRG
jgi:hypothetical protein